MDDIQVHQAILARDIIDMARDNADNADILEYIESLCWELFLIFREQQKTAIDWSVLHGAYDQRYIALREGRKTEDLSEVNTIYAKATIVIENYYQKDNS